MDKWSNVEKTAVDLVRSAGRYGAYLSGLGFEVAGVAEWLEYQIPRLRGAVSAMAKAAVAELGRQAAAPSDNQER